jgi:hypothetical protein
MLKCNSKTVDLNKFLLVPSWSEAGAVAFNFSGPTNSMLIFHLLKVEWSYLPLTITDL